MARGRRSFPAIFIFLSYALSILANDNSPYWGKVLMQAEVAELAGQSRPGPLPLVSRSSAPVNGVTSCNASLLDPLELESLVLNMDASLRVHARHQFFTWTQGLLQNLFRHELLICALRNAEPMSFHVDSFATSPLDLAFFSEQFRRDTSLVPHLIKTWEDNYFQPVVCEAGNAGRFERSALALELNRIGANALLAHGTYDMFGRPASFFTFACRSGTLGPKQVCLVELIVPFLHLAWLRTQINRPAESPGINPSQAHLLTSREREILQWIHLGKSNIEIGAILKISPLTVKNHVQKILRKLNVQNRTQAVGKALALRILSI
jgi:transcriptional regulator EpsA